MPRWWGSGPEEAELMDMSTLQIQALQVSAQKMPDDVSEIGPKCVRVLKLFSSGHGSKFPNLAAGMSSKP
jgi:hypothetical protein